MILSAGTGKLFKRLNREPDVFTIDLFGNTFNYLLCLKVVPQNSRRGEEQREKWDNTWDILKYFFTTIPSLVLHVTNRSIRLSNSKNQQDTER